MVLLKSHGRQNYDSMWKKKHLRRKTVLLLLYEKVWKTVRHGTELLRTTDEVMPPPSLKRINQDGDKQNQTMDRRGCEMGRPLGVYSCQAN